MRIHYVQMKARSVRHDLDAVEAAFALVTLMLET